MAFYYAGAYNTSGQLLQDLEPPITILRHALTRHILFFFFRYFEPAGFPYQVHHARVVDVIA